MPVIFEKQIESSVSVCVWQITETEDFFWQLLSLAPTDGDNIKSCHAASLRLEKLACRAALAHILKNTSINLSYSPEGQPKIDGRYISFSHCHTHVAVAVSPTAPVGIDIESIQDRILKLYSKFLNESEIKQFDVTDKNQLYFCWSAKEAIYKWTAGKVHDFVNHISIAQKNDSYVGKAFLNDQWFDVPLYQFDVDGKMLVVAVLK